MAYLPAMSETRAYQSVEVRTTGRRGWLYVVGRQHVELGVADTRFNAEVQGPPAMRGAYHDTSILSEADPVEGAVLRIWNLMAEADLPDPAAELRALVAKWWAARTRAAKTESVSDYQDADDAAQAVAEYVADYVMPDRQPYDPMADNAEEC